MHQSEEAALAVQPARPDAGASVATAIEAGNTLQEVAKGCRWLE